MVYGGFYLFGTDFALSYVVALFDLLTHYIAPNGWGMGDL